MANYVGRLAAVKAGIDGDHVIIVGQPALHGFVMIGEARCQFTVNLGEGLSICGAVQVVGIDSYVIFGLGPGQVDRRSTPVRQAESGS